MKKYVIDEEVLLKLLIADMTLNELYNGGVDNWDFYSEVQDNFDGLDEIANEMLDDFKLSEEM
ncbi:MAG: hypothetical protein ACRCUJ_03445 [Phocaeicola sp.]